MESRVVALEEKVKVANHRIDDLEATTKRIESLTLSVEKLAISIENMAKEQTEFKTKTNDLANRLLTVEQLPAKNKAYILDKYIGQAISLLVGAGVAYLLTTIFH